MASGKRYYWIKLKEGFMSSDTVDYLMGLPNGASYVVLYQMLILKTINTDGRLARRIGEVIIPYDAEKIQRDCKWFSIDTVRVALNAFIQLGLVYQDTDGVLVMADHQNLVGSETDYATQKRNQRLNASTQNADNVHGSVCQPVLEPVCNDVHTDVCDNVHGSVCQHVHTDIRDKRLEIRDKRLDTREKEKEKEKENISFCTTPETAAVLTLPLNDHSEYPITQEYIDELSSLYPAVDVMQEFRNMRGWCDGNPTRRKTRRGIKAFINGWLIRAQDKGGFRTLGNSPLPKYQPGSSGADRIAMMIERGDFNDT